jgi:hypothetical protein
LALRRRRRVHDGIGMWVAARRLNAGKLVWPKDGSTTPILSRAQFDALVLGARTVASVLRVLGQMHSRRLHPASAGR